MRMTNDPLVEEVQPRTSPHASCWHDTYITILQRCLCLVRDWQDNGWLRLVGMHIRLKNTIFPHRGKDELSSFRQRRHSIPCA